ncbi:tetratricopeptide repeat protein, partial [Microcoleus sp. herbarium14]|uniref:tetratricopeptide repeat protein n=1 Tax=Microcoleus sp. herbarium14 TaxID=3055439 RepID=UPI002FD02CFA
THPELLDDGLVAAMLEEADNLKEQGELNNADWLKYFAGGLSKVDGDFLAGIALQGEADRLLEQGSRQDDISQFREALQSWEQALTIYQKIGNRDGEAASLCNLGIAYNSLRQYDRAIEFHQQSLEISRKTGHRQWEANSLDGLGNVYNSLGKYDQAIEFHQQSLEISREIRNRDGEVASLCNLGNVYNSLGKYDKAIEFHQQSLEISRKIEYGDERAASFCGLGLAYDSLGQYDKAIEFHQKILEISQNIGDSDGEAASLCNLGNAYDSLGQYHKAIEFYQQSLEISQKTENRQWETNALCNLGLTYYQVSKRLGMRYKSIPKILAFLLKKIFIILDNYYLEQAESQLRTSLKIRETLRSELVNNDHKASIFETQLSAYRNLQRVLVARSQFKEALEISEMSRTRAFVELLQQTLLTNELPANDQTNKLSIPKIQQIARDRNSTIVEYSIVNPEIYIWVIQPNGNITHRDANLEPLNQQNQSLKQIILKTRISIGTTETDDEGNKIQL